MMVSNGRLLRERLSLQFQAVEYFDSIDEGQLDQRQSTATIGFNVMLVCLPPSHKQLMNNNLTLSS